jgi:hypothetical protein
MSDKVEETKTEKTVKAKKPGAGEGKKPAEHHARATTKSKWSLERCQKYAHRFQNEAAWQNGNPSSYKAAKAHGWVAQCMGHGEKTHRKAG